MGNQHVVVGSVGILIICYTVWNIKGLNFSLKIMFFPSKKNEADIQAQLSNVIYQFAIINSRLVSYLLTVVLHVS